MSLAWMPPQSNAVVEIRLGMERALALAAEAGDRSARAAGREYWAEADADVARAELARLTRKGHRGIARGLAGGCMNLWWKAGYIAAFAALAVFACVPAHCDELDYQRHHPSGAALVTVAGTRYTAAYQEDNFDPEHTAALKCSQMFRVVLVPESSQQLNVGSQDRHEQVTVTATASGHSVLTFGEWRIEMISNDVDERERLRLGGSFSMAAHVMIAVRRDAILITFVEAQW